VRVVLRDPELFLAITTLIVLGGLVTGAIYAAISQVTRGPDPPA
jgi:hypothetical protein